MRNKGIGKERILELLGSSSGAYARSSVCVGLMPGHKLHDADAAAGAGQLNLLRLLCERGHKCSYKGADAAEEQGFEDVVQQLREWGVLGTKQILLQIVGQGKGDNEEDDDERGGDDDTSYDESDGKPWQEDVPLAEWTGVTREHDGTITSIKLNYALYDATRLQGRIPDEINQLTDLKQLCLLEHGLPGRIPETIGDLSQLDRLWLEGNVLTGPIPESIGHLKRLQSLAVPVCRLSGYIPSSVGGLTNLQHLSLEQNNLTGRIFDGIGNLRQLTFLSLSTNVLTGPLPPAIGELHQLTRLGVAENEFTGGIPASFANLTNLTSLNMSGNQLTGPVPQWLSVLGKLKWLKLGRNKLTGEIPSEISRMTNLEVLELGDNELTGRIPDALPRGCRTIEFHSNKLTGSIPPTIAMATDLVSLDLSGNQLEGRIPDELGLLQSLRGLKLNNNMLTGPVPQSFSSLTSIRLIFLNDNRLTDPAQRQRRIFFLPCVIIPTQQHKHKQQHSEKIMLASRVSASKLATRAFSTSSSDVVLVSFARTPIGKLAGALGSLTAPKLGAVAVKAAVERAGIKAADVEEVYLGNVVSAGVGQSPARQAAIYAGLEKKTDCTTINKVCASGMKSVMMAAQAISTGYRGIMVAGGFESMTNIPYYLPNARAGYRLGNGTLVDGLIHDGLWDVYNNQHMGMCGEACADKFSFSRADQDAYAIESYKRAADAWAAGKFAEEIVPVEIVGRKGDKVVVTTDEEFTNINLEKVGSLRPAFKKDGTVTAANASTLNDGAAAMVLMSAQRAKDLGLKPLARIRGFGDAAKDPVEFTTAPADAIPIAAKNAGVQVSDIEYHEINEAFSVVSLANMKLLNLDHSRVNVHGGAVALGHPIGSSGARIIGTLYHVLKDRNATLGCASICNGGGAASAIVIERLN